MKNKEFHHQGDVQVLEIEQLPSGLKPMKKQPVAYGELSGHQHVITGDYELFESENGDVFAAVGSDGAMLQHIHESTFTSFETDKQMPVADHGTVTLTPEKTYKIGIHKKYNPFEKVFERVID